jgi:hypothetical protein
MITKNQIAAIHIAKNQAGLNDQEYRDLLELAAGVRSCKELSPEDVTQVLNALKIKINHRKGWQNRQLKIFRRYCKYCFMSETEVRELLFETFGVFHEETPTLTNADFDDSNFLSQLIDKCKTHTQEDGSPCGQKVEPEK